MCRVGFGVWLNAFFNTSSCLALIVVRGPRRFEPFAPSSGLLFSACESPRQSGSPSIEPFFRKITIKWINESQDAFWFEFSIGFNLLDRNHLVSFYYRYSYFVLTYLMDPVGRVNLNRYRLNRLTRLNLIHHLEYDALVHHPLHLPSQSPIADLIEIKLNKKKISNIKIPLNWFSTPWKSKLKSQVPNPIDCFKSNYNSLFLSVEFVSSLFDTSSKSTTRSAYASQEEAF